MDSRMKKFLPLLLATICLSASAFAKMPGGSGTSYYVSPTGADSNNGTSAATPWQTITKINATTFSCGDTLLFQGGASFVFNTAIYIARTGGDTGKFVSNCSGATPFTISTYGSGQATITNSTTDAIEIFNMAGVMISNLILVGPGTNAGNVNGVWIDAYADATTKYDFVYMTNLTISGFRGGVLLGGDNGTTGFTNVSLLNSDVSNNGDFGFSAYGNAPAPSYAHGNVFLQNVKTFNNPGRASQPNPTGLGVSFGSIKGGVLRKSAISNNGTLDTYGPVGVLCFESKNLVLEFNESYLNKTGAAQDGEGMDFDGGVTESIARWNYIHENQGAGHLLYSSLTSVWFNNTLQGNVFQNNGSGPSNVISEVSMGGVTASPSALRANLIGNTFYSNRAANSMISFVNTSASLTTGLAANNIFYGNGTLRNVDAGIANPVGFIFQGNDYFGTVATRWNNVSYASIALWRAAVTAEETYRGANTSLISDPTLTTPGSGGTCFVSGIPSGPQPCPSSYLLLAGSPMLNAGQNLSSVFGIQSGGRDYFGNTVPAPSNGNYDVGANQKTQ